ncbi:MAG: murein biosynthesis integral membrane protein MurJ [Chloroflexota bacterium]
MTDAPGGAAPADEAPRTPATTGAATTQALARAGLIVTGAFLLSRLLGYVRVVVLGAQFGIGPELDAFFAAFRIPDLLFQLVAAGALSSALIPVIAGLVATDEEQRAWRVVSTVATLMLIVLLVLAVVVLIAAPVLVPAITPGFDAATTGQTVELTRIMVLSPVILALGAVATSVLNARDRFGASAIAPLAYNLAIIGAAVFLAGPFGVTGLAIGVVAGSACHLLVQIPPLRELGFRFRPSVDLRDAQARKALVLMAPRALGLGATQIVFVVMTSLASTLPPGSVTEFNFAFTLLQIPIGVIGVPLGIVLLPSLSREAAIGGALAYRRLLGRALDLLAYAMVVITGLGIVVAGDLTRLLFGYGRVEPAALEQTAATLQVFLIGLTAHALIAVLARAFYARQDTITPVAAALVAVVVDIAAALVLVEPLGLIGLAAAIAAGAWAETIVLALLLERKVPDLALIHVARTIAMTAVITAAGAAAATLVDRFLVAAWGVEPTKVLLFVRLALSTAAGGLVVVAGSLALRIGELPTIVGLVTDVLRRRRPA